MVMLFVLGWWGWSLLLIWWWSLQTRFLVPCSIAFVQWICWNEHKTSRLYGSWCREIKRNHMRRNSWNATSMLWHICGLSISAQLCYHFGSAWLLPNWCRAPAAISCLSETHCQDKCEIMWAGAKFSRFTAAKAGNADRQWICFFWALVVAFSRIWGLVPKMSVAHVGTISGVAYGIWCGNVLKVKFETVPAKSASGRGSKMLRTVPAVLFCPCLPYDQLRNAWLPRIGTCDGHWLSLVLIFLMCCRHGVASPINWMPNNANTNLVHVRLKWKVRVLWFLMPRPLIGTGGEDLLTWWNSFLFESLRVFLWNLPVHRLTWWLPFLTCVSDVSGGRCGPYLPACCPCPQGSQTWCHGGGHSATGGSSRFSGPGIICW